MFFGVSWLIVPGITAYREHHHVQLITNGSHDTPPDPGPAGGRPPRRRARGTRVRPSVHGGGLGHHDLGVGPPTEPDWVSGPIAHSRGIDLTWDLDGDLDGTVQLVHNANQDFTTGQGTGFGSMTITDGDVTWEGRYRGTYTSFLFAGTFVVHGSDGTLMRGNVAATALAPVPTVDLEGVILTRPGR